jgi:hypothetical protein
MVEGSGRIILTGENRKYWKKKQEHKITLSEK